ncbi:hypothetical protein GCM10028857_26150 [Salinarchaeum chitinilyticum]
MARYFLDTGVVIGYTFLHDMWHSESEEVFDSDNSLYVNEAVIFEYCNSTDNNYLESTDVDWETEEGRFGDIIAMAEAAQIPFDLKIDSYDDSELDIETLVEDVISTMQIDDEVDPEMIEEYIRPTLRDFISDELGDRELTLPIARQIGEVLFDTIIDGGRRKREEIRERVTECSVSQDQREKYFSEIDGFINGYIDTVIISEVGHLEDTGFVSTIISSDKNHMYSNKEKIKAITGAEINYLKDTVAHHDYPTAKTD